MRSLKLVSVALLFLVAACKEKKKKEPEEKFFPVISYIKSQVAHVDTSLYSIRKIAVIDTAHSDTTYLRRESFRDAAADFLSLPDISTSDYDDRYTEAREFYESINRLAFVYLPVKPDKEEIQRQEVLVIPGEEKVQTIIINSIGTVKDTVIQKKMLWSVDRSFQVTTIKQFREEPEIISTYKVSWNEDENE
jgi:hypothetical protein